MRRNMYLLHEYSVVLAQCRSWRRQRYGRKLAKGSHARTNADGAFPAKGAEPPIRDEERYMSSIREQAGDVPWVSCLL